MRVLGFSRSITASGAAVAGGLSLLAAALDVPDFTCTCEYFSGVSFVSSLVTFTKFCSCSFLAEILASSLALAAALASIALEDWTLLPGGGCCAGFTTEARRVTSYKASGRLSTVPLGLTMLLSGGSDIVIGGVANSPPPPPLSLSPNNISGCSVLFHCFPFYHCGGC